METFGFVVSALFFGPLLVAWVLAGTYLALLIFKGIKEEWR